MATGLPLEVMLREIRARARTGDERTIVLYGRPLPEHAQIATAQLIAEVRELQGKQYLVDARRDLFEAGDEVRAAAAAVAMLVEAKDLTEGGEGWTLATRRFGTALLPLHWRLSTEQPDGGSQSAAQPPRVQRAHPSPSGMRPFRASRRASLDRPVNAASGCGA